MLRIEQASEAHDERLRLEGKVAGPWVSELRTACVKVLRRPERRLVLDLSEVSFVDREGIALLRELAAWGAVLTHCAPFILDQLDDSER